MSNVTKYYYFASLRVAMRTSAGITYLFGDHLGSTSAAIDPSGNLTKQGYFAFGGVRYNNGTLPTDYTFTGQKSDASDGLMYYGARYYDASIGRFTQPDTIVSNFYNPQDLNRYAYVRNNPLNYVDPTGHSQTCEESCGGGACGADCQQLVQQYQIAAQAPQSPESYCQNNLNTSGCPITPATSGGAQTPYDEFCAKHPYAKACREDTSSNGNNSYWTPPKPASPESPIIRSYHYHAGLDETDRELSFDCQTVGGGEVCVPTGSQYQTRYAVNIDVTDVGGYGSRRGWVAIEIAEEVHCTFCDASYEIVEYNGGTSPRYPLLGSSKTVFYRDPRDIDSASLTLENRICCGEPVLIRINVWIGAPIFQGGSRLKVINIPIDNRWGGR